MTRYKLTIEYDGGPFVGWQRQDNGPSVQAALEDAVLAFSGEAATVQGSGRTDAGVHATGQVAHLDLAKDSNGQRVRDALNFHLKPHPVAVLTAEAVDEDFHARFSATRRAYLYRIVNRRAPLALDHGRAWFVPKALNTRAMQAGADLLLGHHDFSAFRAADCQARSPMKTLDKLEVTREGDEISIIAAARSFLYHQVRNMVGSLAWVGQGKWPPEMMGEVLTSRDRRKAGPSATAHGLYLTEVSYD
ncbi:MAG: tRNA pseudouridine(38-40) synthase TruA [Pseudomonadota bacterium]